MIMQDEFNDSKRKRDSSTSSGSMSLSMVPKKHKEDFSVSLNNSVFSPPAPMTSGHHSANAPLPGGIIAEEPRSESSSPSTSVGMNSANDSSSTNSSPSSHSSLSTKASIDQSVARAIDNRMRDYKEEIKQDVYLAMKHDMDVIHEARFADVNAQLAEMTLKYETLEQNFDREVLFVKKKSIENDQYARRYTVRIRGVEEHQGENLKHIVCDIVFHYMHIRINLYDIELAHRAGNHQPRARGQPKKHRVILCRFKDRGLKYDIMLQRKMLKGSGIFFEEDLCKEYEEILNDMRVHPFIDRAWSWNGKVMAQDKNGDKHYLRYGVEWNALFDDMASRPDLIGQGAHLSPSPTLKELLYRRRRRRRLPFLQLQQGKHQPP